MLLVLLAFCIISSVSDLKFGIVKNSTVIIFLIISVILNTIDFLIFAPDRFILFLINVGIVCAASFFLYATGVWAGGDTKFTVCAALLFPTGFYLNADVSYNLIFAVVLSFAVGFIYLVFETAINIRKSDSDESIISKKDIFNFLKNYFIMLSNAYFISELLTLIGKLTGVSLSLFVFPAVLAVAYFSNRFAFFRKLYYIIPIIIGDIVLSFFTGKVNLSFNVMTYVFMFVFAMLRIAVSKFNCKEINTSEVKKGMVLSAATVFGFRNSRVKNLPRFTTENLKSRLTQEEAEAVVRWENSKYGSPKVMIVRKIPFIIFISIGFIMYFIGSCVLN